jgi:hypothetical protein
MTLILSPFLNSSDPADLGVPPDQIPTVALLDGFSPTTLGIADHIILSQGR